MVGRGTRRGSRRGRRVATLIAALGVAVTTLIATGTGALAAPGWPAEVAPLRPGAQLAPHLRPGLAPSATTCDNPSEPGKIIESRPWHQQWLAPERVWPFSTGEGVKVAVIDSGTDANHPQLKGRVTTGWDALAGADGGTIDCVSHGTAVASIIAATAQEGVGFQGLAPGATILPVRITEREAQQGDKGSSVDMAKFAAAIRKAVDKGATVINLSVVVYYSAPELQSAIEYARSRDVVVVAAVGNEHREDGKPDPIPYPAALEGVIGVGAIDELGARVNKSQVGPYVDIVAPGGAVIAATRLVGHNSWTGTSFAAPMVSAAAALIRAAEPKLKADEVAKRLIATADPARGGLASEAYGHGVVNLYRAVTERVAAGQPQALPPLPAVSVDPVAERKAAAWHRTSTIALAVGLAAGAVAVVLAGVAFVLPLGRRRRWRPARWRPAPPVATQVEDPEQTFFQLPVTAVSDAAR